jgi:hypothetical protein
MLKGRPDVAAGRVGGACARANLIPFGRATLVVGLVAPSYNPIVFSTSD